MLNDYTDFYPRATTPRTTDRSTTRPTERTRVPFDNGCAEVAAPELVRNITARERSAFLEDLDANRDNPAGAFMRAIQRRDGKLPAPLLKLIRTGITNPEANTRARSVQHRSIGHVTAVDFF